MVSSPGEIQYHIGKRQTSKSKKYHPKRSFLCLVIKLRRPAKTNRSMAKGSERVFNRSIFVNGFFMTVTLTLLSPRPYWFEIIFLNWICLTQVDTFAQVKTSCSRVSPALACVHPTGRYIAVAERGDSPIVAVSGRRGQFPEKCSHVGGIYKNSTFLISITINFEESQLKRQQPKNNANFEK